MPSVVKAVLAAQAASEGEPSASLISQSAPTWPGAQVSRFAVSVTCAPVCNGLRQDTLSIVCAVPAVTFAK